MYSQLEAHTLSHTNKCTQCQLLNPELAEGETAKECKMTDETEILTEAKKRNVKTAREGKTG